MNRKQKTGAGVSGMKKSSLQKQRANLFPLISNQIARVTLPERRHREQTLTWHGVPLTIAFTRRTLGFQVRLERLCEWETLIPKVTPLPQTSHFAIFPAPPYLYHLSNGYYNTTTNGEMQEQRTKIFGGRKKRGWAHCIEQMYPL